MTVVLAVACADGVVIAADTQITDKGRGMSYPAQKLHALGDRAAWGGSGARAVLVDVEAVLTREADTVLASDDVGRALQQRVLPILTYHYEHYIPDVPGEEPAGTPASYVLAAGHADGASWIVEIDPHGMVSRYEDIGFHAIGSGAAMAQQAGALLAHHPMRARPVAYGVVAAVRVLDALQRTSPSVGDPFSVCRATDEGAVHLDDDEVAQARRQVERWEDLEHEALDTLFRR